MYWAEIVFRNFAFLRVEQAYRENRMLPKRLLDLGHDMTDDPDIIAFGVYFTGGLTRSDLLVMCVIGCARGAVRCLRLQTATREY